MKKIIPATIISFFAMVTLAAAIPSVGQIGVDTTYKNGWHQSPYQGQYINEWTVCRADTQSAWVSADNGGNYNAVSVCNELGYTNVDAWGGTWGDVCGYNGQPGYEYYDFFGNSDPTYLRYTVHWRCVDYQDNGSGNDVPEFPSSILAMMVSLLVFASFRSYSNPNYASS